MQFSQLILTVYLKQVVCCPMSEKCDPLGNSVEFDFMIGIGHLGPNELNN